MRKILLLGAALSLFSCSQEDQTALNNETEKDITTIDNVTGYRSPYEYSSIHGLHIGAAFDYRMVNNSSFIFEITPFFGLGSYDGEVDNDIYWEPAGGSYGIGDPSSAYYAPNLTANGNKYGNFLPAEVTVLNAFRSRTIHAPSDYPVPVNNPAYSFYGFEFNFPGSVFQPNDAYFLQKSGKLFFIKFRVALAANNATIAESIVKLNFPDYRSNDFGANWETIGREDSVFREKLIFNKHSKELCIIIDDSSQYKDFYRFTYQNVNYRVGIRSTPTLIEMYLE